MKNLETITIPSVAWAGPYMMAFVYAKSGHNFIVKGRRIELEVVAKVKELAPICLCHYTFWNHGKSMGTWKVEGIPDVIIRRRLRFGRLQYIINKSTQYLYFRRMPNKWLPVFDGFLPERYVAPVSQKKNLFGEAVPRADW